MRFYWQGGLLLTVFLLPLVFAQEDEYDDRGLHKRKRRPHFQQGGGGPCGYFRDNGVAGTEEDGRSVKLVAALGGAAAGYYLGQKHGQHHQQPVINNIINTQGGGAPCGSIAAAPPVIGGGLLGSHLGGGHLGGGHFGGGHFGGLAGQRNGGVNWDRTIRQFNRHVVRPITRWF